jgi:dimethylamine/trimethylamine dehydrogenase
LRSLGIRVVTGHTVSAVAEGGASGEDTVSGDKAEWECGGIVLVTERRANDSLYRTLKADPRALADAGIEAVYRVGDCVAPRIPADAIFDAHRLAREIDSDEPERPLPFQRERGGLSVEVGLQAG